MNPLLTRLKDGEILAADGGMGSLLFEKGLKPGQCPEKLLLEKPELLEEIAKAYLKAGARIVQTNTFGGSPMKLADYGLEDSTEEINRRGAAVVKKAVEGKAYVSGSCGPTGKILEPYGDAKPEEMALGFERQIKALLEGGAQIICVETMIDLTEACLAVKAAKSLSPETPVMATMTFDKNPKGYFTMMGVSVKDAAAGLEEAGAEIVGSNCGNGLEKMIEIAREFKKVTRLPLLIQSNAGQPVTEGKKLVYPETPEFFREKVPDLIEAGVSIIGGCCGTTPEYVTAIKSAIDARS
jgi:5-methyltetrahydrofolate--homocysteine methyltransferase